MPPSSSSSSSADQHHGTTMLSSFPICCAFPIGEIEVQPVEDPPTKSFVTRIFMSPLHDHEIDPAATDVVGKKYNDDKQQQQQQQHFIIIVIR